MKDSVVDTFIAIAIPMIISWQGEDIFDCYSKKVRNYFGLYCTRILFDLNNEQMQ